MTTTPDKRRRPKPRIPLPAKPPKVETGKDVYKRRPKHVKKDDPQQSADNSK